mmetsp:Transcript_5338/g.14854  ORF Transcript_5338/g.14854 Transcript_5338/m.14854 type:complete len:1457 (-) Transcript_5338:181-4551(-)|eukprot:CAMPEP_0117652236 /NCGR_PEP_ID=MMETSP0804-20121206/2519_1 /TAXON_ID=1074897 /ORGANISM="Tetraselmis astigmatica, Strain CCMP880" /LENGTH=1456 /DNA_ID=CAMNT_0005458269 /DNA_START=174 /DNA_END=4544 /DNA_ORIENTATION=-
MAPSAQSDGRATFKLRRTLAIDFSSAIPQEAARLPRGLHARNMCFHPHRSVIAVGLERCIGEYDVLSGAKLGCAHFVGTPVSMCYMPDGNAIAVLLENGSIMAWNTTNWRSRVICQPLEKLAGDKAMDEGFLAIGHNVLFFAERMHTTIRGVLWNAAADKKKSMKLKLDNYKKPIVGMECGPGGKQLYIAYADFTVRAYNISSQSLAFNPISLASKESRAAVGTGVISVAAHPFIPTASLLMAAFSNGRVGVWEVVPGKQAVRLGQVELPDVADVVGVGLHCPGNAVTAFTYSARTNSYSAYAWQILVDRRSRDVTLLGANMEPKDIKSFAQEAGRAALHHAGSSALYEQCWWQECSWGSLRSPGVGSPAIRSIILSPHDGSLALHLWPSAHKLQAKLIGELGTEEVVAARKLLAIPILQAVMASAPSHSAPLSKVAAMHSPMGFWSEASRTKPLLFSQSLNFLENGKLQSHRLSDGSRGDSVPLPAVDGDGRSLEPQLLVESSVQQASLIFFIGTEPVAKGSKGGSKPSWRFTCLQKDMQDEEGSGEFWFLPGVTGAFFGERDLHFAILEQNLQNAAVYQTQEMTRIRPPIYRVSLEAPGGIFPGVVRPKRERNDDTQEESSQEVDFLDTGDDNTDDETPAGCLMWVALGGRLCMGDLPAGVPPTEGAGLCQLGTPAAQASIQLMPSERVLQVCWQHFTEDYTAGSIYAAGAVLTNMRLLVVSPALQELMEYVPDHFHGSVLPVISCLWVGPALLLMIASGQVMILAWDGSVQPVCSVADKSPTPALVGALGDRLILLRNTEDAMEVSIRAVSLFQPLAIAWATLAERGILPGGVPEMRSALRSLAANYDCSTVDRKLLAVLAVSGAADLAAELVEAIPRSGGSATLACHAAAGNWTRAAGILLSDFQRSVYYPKPPPEGSSLHRKMLSLGRGAAAHGQFGTARQMYEAAGDTSSVLLLAFLAGDFDCLRRYTRYGTTDDFETNSSPADAAEVRRLSTALIAANEAGFQQSVSSDPQWTLKRLYPEGTADGEEWDIAPPGAVPSMQTSQDAMGGRIPPISGDSLVPYLGVSGSAQPQSSVGSGGVGRPAHSDDGGFQEVGADDDDGDMDGGEDAQEAARQAFQMQSDSGFDSSDDESDAGSVSGADASRQRLQIKIRAAAPPEAAADPNALKAAAMNLSLAPASQLKFKRANTADSSFSTEDSSESSKASSPTKSIDLQRPSFLHPQHPPPAAPAPPPPKAAMGFSPPPLPPQPQANPAPGGMSLGLFKAGVTEMEKGTWDQAIVLLTKAMDAVEEEARTGRLDTARKQQRMALMSQYLAAVQMLQYSREAVSGPGASDASLELRAKMLRFTSGLRLESKHAIALKQTAVQRNMEVCNYGFAIGALESLISDALQANASPEYTTKLQQTLEECDAKGGGDASVPDDEDCTVIPDILSQASSAAEVVSLVKQLYEG